jgi:hypothetical protein
MGWGNPDPEELDLKDWLGVSIGENTKRKKPDKKPKLHGTRGNTVRKFK